MQRQRVLVVATTSDYIDLLRQKYPAKSLLFITAPDVRNKATEDRPQDDEELLCKLDHPEKVIDNLLRHILTYGITLKGIACFDCDSMILAAHIAAEFNLSYPSIDTVLACREKSRTRQLWHANGVQTPKYARVSSAVEAVSFFEESRSHCVLKPIDSSGSERVFRCTTSAECEAAYQIICAPQQSPDIIIETYIDGTEYSCDFIIDSKLDNTGAVSHSLVTPIRFTRKIHSPGSVFGTIMAYEVVKFPSGNFVEKKFLSLLAKSAGVLGITRSICMLDFIVTTNDIHLLEMTPRPGGDCLPWLIQHSMNIDILKLALDFAASKEFCFHSSAIAKPLVGLRIHADRPGILDSINTGKVASDPRVREVFIKQKSGHKILLPPEDYDSWNLGHIIFDPYEDIPNKDQCVDLLSLLETKIESPSLYKGCA